MNKVHKIDFSELAEEAPSAPCYQKVMYKQIADVEKDIQNIIFSKADGKYRRFTKNLDEIKEKNIPKIYQIKTKESYRQDNPKGQEKKIQSR